MDRNDNHQITSELVGAYMQCERQAFLLLEGKLKGREHEYSQILKKHARANRLRFEASLEVLSESVVGQKNETQLAVRSGDMTADCVASIKSTTLKLPVPYELYLVTGTYRVSKEQRLQLAFAGYVLNAATWFQLTSGSIVTEDGQKHRINLEPLYPEIAFVVNELRKMIDVQGSNSRPPKLILNVHCPLCPFSNHCRQETEENDNLSLLGKMTQKIMRKYEKKGIFTVKQLSYVFNPRRRRKKSFAVNSIFNF